MNRRLFLIGLAVFTLLSVLVLLPVHSEAHPQEKRVDNFVAPLVFQAAGPTAGSIQETVDEYRAALGGINNLNAPGPLATGRREINWDGGNVNNQTTSISGNPFNGFQVTRGALFTTPDGTGFVQAPPAADPALFPPGGLAGVFNNPTYGTTFKAFSPSRLFSAIGGIVTKVDFFVPGPGEIPATVRGFGAVFTDVDQPDGGGEGKKHTASALIEYLDVNGDLLYSSFVPASPGDGSFSFLGVVFEDARIARVRITSGNAIPGVDDGGKREVVMMDDFIYSEPQRLP